jgi:carboxylesterase type B
MLAAGDPDSLAAAGIVDRHATDAERLALVARASAAAPQRKDLAFLHLELCVKVAGCDVTPIEAQLHALDPGNAAAWSGSLARAAKAGDAAQIESTLTSMAGGERYDTYWNALVAHTASALIRTQVIDGATAAMTATEVVAAQVLPYQPIANGCSGKVLEQPKMLDTCRRLATVFRHGDTYLTEIFGESLAMRLWPKDSPEYREAAEARRVAHYRMDIENNQADRFTGQDGSQRYLQLLATHRTEQEVWLADIATSGQSANPPPGWIESLADR